MMEGWRRVVMWNANKGVEEAVNVGCDGGVEEGASMEGDEDRDWNEDEEVEDEFYGFSDEDRDWNEDEEHEEHVSDGEISMDEEEVTSDDDALSNYQSDDNKGNYESDDDAAKDPKAHKPLKANYFDSSCFGKEPYFGLEGEVILEEGRIFNNVDSFRACLEGLHSCPWRIHASPLPNGITYKIKKLRSEHNCSRIVKNSDATSPWIAKKLLTSFRENPNMGIDTMQEKLAEMYGIECSRSQLYRAKRKCMDEIEGKGSNQYKLLPTYAVEVRKTNPGSYFKLQCERPSLLVNPTFMSRLNFVDYVHPYYNKEMYLAAYGRIIHPIMDHTMWTEVHGDVLQPPPLKRQRGRPRKNRRRAEGEAPPRPSVGKRSSHLRCAKCKEFGHNRRTCQGGPIRGGQAKGGSRGRARGGSSAHGSGGNAIGWTQINVEPVGRGRGRGRTSSAQRGRSTVRGRGRGRSTSTQRGRSTVRGRGRGRSSTSAVQYFGNEGTRGENIAASQGGTQPSQCLTQLTQHF
ncbi:hypothetical protein Vadar_025863 [Vaccinium darrowii]|uniref:Uncharacterized protein n=1 Tax=Vaccinium darrowii TaxID=229202 RepID=A0ACB7XCB5_9ERIC|nr:hypothetical protein Vadar_025863 [Vaccinium darrowii]